MSAPAQVEATWRALSDRLRRFFVSRAGDPQVAADLVQETFLRIQARLDTLEDDRRLESWVFSIARNLLTDHFRRREHAPLPEGMAEAIPEERSESNLNERVAGWLPGTIDNLPEKYREALRLHELEGLTQAAIAERLGLSLSGAKSRIQRGRTKLRDALTACCQFDTDARGNVLDYVQLDEDCCSGDESS